jgi:hypothetical protein
MVLSIFRPDPTKAPTKCPSLAPTRLPTVSPTSCSDSPCPISCPDYYLEYWDVGDCRYYCVDEPENGECSIGGSGCTSSCYSCSDSPCPTSCPEGYEPSEGFVLDDCTVYCLTKPFGGQCKPGGSGCTSSCVLISKSGDGGGTSSSLSTGGLVGVVLGGGVFLIVAVMGVVYFTHRMKSKPPLNKLENEMRGGKD